MSWCHQSTNTLFYLSHADICKFPQDRTVAYARIVIDHQPQKEDPNRVRITVGGNLIDYPFKLTMRTADMVSSKSYGIVSLAPRTPALLALISKTCTSKHHSIGMSTWKCQYHYFLLTLLIITSWWKKPSMATSTWKPKGHIWTATSGYTCKQTTQRTFGVTWILQTIPHARPLETCQSPCLVQLMCGWFWNKIY